jgi:C4-dicarboxylate-specific signal transduction histidine kinase
VEIVETLEAAALQLGATIQRLRAEEALKVAYQKLEDRVMERTVELSLANENLRAEIDVRRQAEEHLRESRNMLQSLIDGITDALILLDCDMRIRMINRGAAEYYEITSYEEIIEKQCFNAVGTVGACTDCEIPQAVKRGQTLVFERPGLTDDKKLEKVSVYPIREKDGEISGAIVRISDITEEKRMERQLIQSEKMASLGILVSSIAHEINNPNSFITFNIPILREYLAELIGIADEYAEKNRDIELFHMSYPEFRKDVSNLVDNIEHGASRISTFVANLREFSQGNKDRHRAWLKLPSVVDKVLSICRSQIKKRIKNFEVVIPDDLAPIYADEYSLEQVLINLIMNAVQAADKKSSAVKLTAANGNTWRDYTIIEVTDNGCGMDPKTISAIFTPFFTTKIPTEGTGLGLYVCHNLIKNLGGRIEVESKPGEGSTFSVYLPDKDRRLEPRP